MSAEPFLHDHKDFKDLLSIVSRKHNIVPQLVEKDYWIMHCLWGIQKQDLSFELKGGTSLSKGFGVIERFSEDIDIRINPPAGMDVKCGRNHDKDIHVESRLRFFEWVKDTLKIPGIVSIERDTAHDDKIQCRNGGIRMRYTSHFTPLSDTKDGILLEVGFDDTTPNQPMTISSWAYDHASAMVPCHDTRAIDVKCYCIEYTFVEKLQAVSTKFRQQQQNGGFPTNFMRHYYDIYQLLARSEVQRFIGTSEYEVRKEQRFRPGDNRKISENEAFLLRNPVTREFYTKQYQTTQSLYYKGQVPFDDILARIAQHIDRL
ncbi:MAG: nucleotidyl transferase AbiEii/AbiGii toxin family protein [Nitrospira sp.]